MASCAPDGDVLIRWKLYERNGFTYLKRESDPEGGPDSIWLERPADRPVSDGW